MRGRHRGSAPPVVNDYCGTAITPAGPVITQNPDPVVCEGTITYTWTYTDCAGLSDTWSHVFTIDRTIAPVAPADGASTVECVADIVVPTPPVVNDYCGTAITPAGPVITQNPDPVVCEGTITYTWTYTDCAGLSDTWSHQFTIDRTIAPVAPADGASTVSAWPTSWFRPRRL